MIENIKKDEQIKKYLDNKQIIKTIYIENKLINSRSVASSIGGRNDMGRLLSPLGRDLIIENIKKGVFSGESLTVLFSKEKIFPPTFSQLISVGGQTGSLDSMFASVAKYYEEEFDTAVSNLSSLIEPIMIVFMGATIGGLMIALYSPIFNVGAIIN